MARRNRGRAVSGVLLLDKPAGITSNRALQKVRGIFEASKAGHTGSLDPLATGLLPICLGDATKFSQYLLDADKTYEVTARFGVITDSGDTDGAVLEERDASALTEDDIRARMDQFRGPIHQVPPIFSAIKVRGKPLYEYARQGLPVEIKSRDVTIMAFELLGFSAGTHAEARFRVHCSKGTYIRSLIVDLGDALGCGGTVCALRRTASGGFDIADALTLEQLQAHRDNDLPEALDPLLLSAEVLMQNFPKVEISPAVTHFFILGQAVMVDGVYRLGAEGDIVRVVCEGAGFIGAAAITEDGKIQPKRLCLVTPS